MGALSFRHKAQLVDDQQLELGQSLLHVEQSSFVPSFHQLMDQGGSCGKANTQALLTCCKSQTEGYVGLASAGGACVKSCGNTLPRLIGS